MSSRPSSPRILYVSAFWPGEVASCGAEVRAHNVLRALQEIGTVDVVMLCDEKIKGNLISESGREFKVAHAFDLNPQPNRGFIRKVRWTFDPRIHYPQGFSVGEDAMGRLLPGLDAFDVVWFFQLRTANMFPTVVWPRSVVDIDDVQSTNQRAILQMGTRPLERINAFRRQFSWRRREKLLGNRFTVLAVCSEEDREYLRGIGVGAPVHVIPNGFERPSVEPVRSPAKPPRIGFIGTFPHPPNRDGIHWFVKNCWEEIKREMPDLRLRLVGQGSDGPLAPSGQDIEGLGWLANPSEEIKTWSAMVVPIRMGAGTRVKIAQAFSHKCPIVSTSFGALGYGKVDGREMLLADSAQAFAGACLKVIREPEKAAQMAEAAWVTFLEKWTWDAIRPLVWAAAEECLRVSRPG